MIRKTKWGSFEVSWRDPGKPGEAKDKRNQKTFETYREAKAYEDKIRMDRREGNYVTPSDYTVESMAQSYLEAGKRRGWKIQTYDQAKRHVNKYIKPSLGAYKLAAIKFEQIECAGAEWRQRISAKTVNKIYTTLHGIYEFARHRKHSIAYNPMDDVERMQIELSVEDMERAALDGLDTGEERAADGTLRVIRADEVLTAEELRKLIEGSKPGIEKAKHMTAICTGLRHGELNGLRWECVDLKHGVISVNRSLTQLKGGSVLERPKNKAAYRHIKIPPELSAELRRWKLACPPSTHGYVFCNLEGKPMTRKHNNTVLKRTMRKAGIAVLTMNNLRHSFASQQLIHGTSPLEVSKLMGHSDLAVTLSVYARWCMRDNSTAHSVFERILNERS